MGPSVCRPNIKTNSELGHCATLTLHSLQCNRLPQVKLSDIDILQSSAIMRQVRYCHVHKVNR